MPRPATLPTIDWKAVFSSGQPFSKWITTGEFPEHRKTMKAKIDEQQLSPETIATLGGLSRTVHVIAIAEDWCGDVVKQVPVLEALAKHGKKIKTRYITRQQHPDVFARFLTNGGEAIPKFVFVTDKWVEVGNWGPMPSAHRLIIARGKAAGDVGAARKRVSALFEGDPNNEASVQELVDLLVLACCTRP